jgi:hypothetical protein
METPIRVENAPSRAKIVLFKDDGPSLPNTSLQALAATDIGSGSHSQASLEPMD